MLRKDETDRDKRLAKALALRLQSEKPRRDYRDDRRQASLAECKRITGGR